MYKRKTYAGQAAAYRAAKKPRSRVSASAVPRRLPLGSGRVEGFYGRFTRAKAAGELKFLDTSLNQAGFDAGPVIVNDTLCNVPVGSSESERIGREIDIKSISLRLSVTSSGGPTLTTMDQADVFRLLIVQDKQPNGSVPLPQQVLTGAAGPYNMYNLEYEKRFVILHDKTITVNSDIVAVCTAPSTTDPVVQLLKGRKALSYEVEIPCNIKVMYNTTGTSGLDLIGTNNIFYLLTWDGPTVTEGGPGLAEVDGVARIRYSD